MKSYEYQGAILASSLSSKAKLVGLAISYHYNWTEARASFPSISTLVRETGLSKATIHRAKIELVSQGYLGSCRRFNDSNLYLPLIPPMSHSETLVVSQGRTNNEFNNEVNYEKKRESNDSLVTNVKEIKQEDIILDKDRRSSAPAENYIPERYREAAKQWS